MAADERAELEELRRLEELEARAAASKPQRDPFSLENIGRQAGLATRYGVEGLASLPGIFINPFQQAAGAKTFSGATSDLLTRLGLPTEQTDTEHLSGAISRALASGGGSIAAAKTIPAAIGAGPAVVNNIFAQQPALQAAQAAAGAGAGEFTQQAGGNQWAQLLASAAAPLGVNTVAGVTKAAGRGGKELFRPITQTGAQQIAADVVGNVARDKVSAAQRIEDWLAQRQRGIGGVPGSQPTAAGVAQDYGLTMGEQAASRGAANPDFAARFAANNEARLADLAQLRATKDRVQQFETARDAVAGPLRESAFAAATRPVNYDPVIETLQRVTASPSGGRIQSEKALELISARVTKYLDEGRLHPEDAYGLYKDIGEMVKGKLTDSSGAPVRLAAGLALDVQKALGREIEKVAPGFQKYLNTYHRLSRPIDRLEVITERLGGRTLSHVTTSAPQAGPGGMNFGLSQHGMRSAVDDLENNLLPKGPTGLPLAPRQREVLNRVSEDLNTQALAQRGGKMPGSDTYQNMATSNLMESIFGKQIAAAGVLKPAASALNFAYSKTGLEKRIQDMINEAYLDPEKMAQLLRLARTKRGSLTGDDLATMANQNIYGGLLGGAAGGS